MNPEYINRKTYLKDFINDDELNNLVEFIGERFANEFDSYWHKFGYEIGGPVCFSYVHWISETIKKHPEVDDIAFVARDGYLLQKVFDLLPDKADVSSKYVYAPRSVYNNCQKSNEARAQYKEYLSKELQGTGTIASIDTVTMLFSSQRLIKMSTDRPVLGLFWVVLGTDFKSRKGLLFDAFQKEMYHTIWNWNLMEFIMTSPESPIRSIVDGKPIYSEKNSFENERVVIFTEIEKGVIEFAKNIKAAMYSADVAQRSFAKSIMTLSNKSITEWVNAFMKNPCDEDLKQFDAVRFSELPDHSDSVPLHPWKPLHDFQNMSLKDKLWFFSIRHQYLYAFLHWGNMKYKKLKSLSKNISYDIYNGKNLDEIVEKVSLFDVVSFDIFDTLIKRTTETPQHVFNLLEADNGISGFADLRVKAELLARQNAGKPNGEINIIDIYDELAKFCNINVSESINAEVEKEFEVCYANFDLQLIVNELAAKEIPMIAVSDMYLTQSVLRQLLDRNGFTAIKDIYVSNEFGVNKGSGKLQQVIWNMLGRDRKVVHIGDNEGSDVSSSIGAGWSAVLYKK